MNSRLIMCNIPTGKDLKSLKFYSHLFGGELARSLNDTVTSYHYPVSAGVQLNLTPRHASDEQITCYFAVESWEKSVQELERLGAKLVRPNIPLTIPKGAAAGMAKAGCKLTERDMGDPPYNVGVAAILKDPDGNLVGIVQLSKWAQPWFQGSVTKEQLTAHEHGLAAAKAYFQEK